MVEIVVVVGGKDDLSGAQGPLIYCSFSHSPEVQQSLFPLDE